MRPHSYLSRVPFVPGLVEDVLVPLHALQHVRPVPVQHLRLGVAGTHQDLVSSPAVLQMVQYVGLARLLLPETAKAGIHTWVGGIRIILLSEVILQ